MAQPWTMVAWARGPRDRTTLPPQRRRDWSADGGAARVSLGHRSGASPAVPPRFASGWQSGEGSPALLLGRPRRLGPTSAVLHQELSTRAGENGPHGGELLPQGFDACWGSTAKRRAGRGVCGEGAADRAVAVASSHTAAQGANAMGKVLELSDETYQQLVDLAQQQQRTPEEMLRVCLATYEAARYERVHQQMIAEGLLAALPDAAPSPGGRRF